MTKTFIHTTGALLLCIASFSQTKDSKLTKADKLYDQYAYFKSIDVYEKVANQGYRSAELFEKLGDAYFFNAEYLQANKWYTELFKLSGEADPIYYYRYSQTLKSAGNKEKSDLYLAEFSKRSNTDSRAVNYANNKNYLSEIKDDTNQYTIEDAGINTVFSDYGTSFYKDRIVFTSSRLPEQGNGKKDNWTSDYFSSLYSAALSKDGSLSDVQFFAKEIQTKYHESDVVITKDGKTMFFTRNNDKKRKTNESNPVLLKIYKATLNKGKWDNVTELPFNNDNFSCAHPVLSPDEKVLYFSSDMPGGYGDSDIYKVAVNAAADTYGTPVNLGKNINTQGKETFPWISGDHQLYFASDGHLGLGGLDVFVTNIKDDNYTNKVVNMGKPVNSQFDDFCFVQVNDSKLGFFTSNREGGKGKDDIYRFTQQEAVVNINGQVVDNETQQPISNALVNVYDKNHNPIATTNADVTGKFIIPIDIKKENGFYIKAQSPDYDTNEITVNSNAIDLKKGVVIALDKTNKAVAIDKDLAKSLNIKDILFDLDKSSIRPDAEVNLAKILVVLEQNPTMKIDIRSHTDSRQSAAYNLALSQRRAQSTLQWFVAHGIAKSRLTAKGYGESQLLNHCSDGVSCTEAEHQANRRSEFILVKK
jgi:outer membrane protein OmpA-like peptidoglycan-associated protein